MVITIISIIMIMLGYFLMLYGAVGFIQDKRLFSSAPEENLAVIPDKKVIPANDSVRLLDEIVEEMDLSPLHRAYKRTGRRPATKPATMPKILLYANMEHIYSSRKIQSACQRDINFIWLLDGAPAPSHNEIARFRSIRLAERAVEARLQPTIRGRRRIHYRNINLQ